MIRATTLLLIAVAALLGCVAAFPKWHQLDKYTFEEYVEDAGRPYVPGSKAWKHREGLFNARLDDIKRHNSDSTMTWKRGINQFSDWTPEEFKGYNRAQPSYKVQDASAFKYQAVKSSNTQELPRTVDYRARTNPSILTAIKNQGSCGNCWAHSATESIESYFAIEFGQLPVLSTQQITSCTADMWGCGGGSYGPAWDYVRSSEGINEEWTYPFTDFFHALLTKNDTSKCKNITKEFPTIHTHKGAFVFTWWPKANVSSHYHIEPNNGLALTEALALIGPQSISVAADTWSDYESGILKNNYSSYAANISWQEIDHAVQAVGYGHDLDLGLDYWIVRNSWGTTWGEEGFIRLYRPAVEPCGNLTGQVICGTSGILCDPAYPVVAELKKQNGYYF